MSHGSPRVTTSPLKNGVVAGKVIGCPPSVQVLPPFVEKAKPERPGVPGITGGTVNGSCPKPVASFQPATMLLLFCPTAIVVSLRPSRPAGGGDWSALTRTFGPTMMGGGTPGPLSEVKGTGSVPASRFGFIIRSAWIVEDLGVMTALADVGPK